MIQPPPLRNDCFAMPQGVDWMPVDTALARLREALHTVTPVETMPTLQAAGRGLGDTHWYLLTTRTLPAVARRHTELKCSGHV